jgi:hypothetical protein
MFVSRAHAASTSLGSHVSKYECDAVYFARISKKLRRSFCEIFPDSIAPYPLDNALNSIGTLLLIFKLSDAKYGRHVEYMWQMRGSYPCKRVVRRWGSHIM